MHNTKLQKNHHLFLVFIHFVNLLYNKCWDHNVEYLNYKGLDFCSFFPILFFGLNHRLNIVLPCSQPFAKTRKIIENMNFHRYFSKGQICKGK